MTGSWTAAAACAAALVIVAGCDRRGGDPSAPSAPRIELNVRDSRQSVVVAGLSGNDLTRLRQYPLTTDQWSALLRVAVAVDRAAPAGVPPMLGAYTIDGTVLRFTPRFPLAPGQRYEAVFDPSRLPGAPDSEAGASAHRVTAEFDIPAPVASSATRVEGLLPSGDELPENVLRLYIRFSRPMSLDAGRDHVHLVDESNRPIEDPFLPLDVGLWNEDRTRYTLLFDPGRVKSGIRPNEQMGRPLVAGRTYTLVVDREWRDGDGQPLGEPYRRTFHVAPPQDRAIEPATWRIGAPRAGTRDPLTVSFPRPLDYALLARALTVSSGEADLVSGDVTIDPAGVEWRFVPRESWTAGEYRLAASSVLEDIAGNRIGRPFELAIASNAPVGGSPRAAVLPFRVSP